MRNKQYMPIGKDPRFNPYHTRYDSCRLDSQILNGGSMRINASTILDWSRQGIENLLSEWEGDKDGCYTNSLNETVVALLPKCQQELENIYLRFEAYQQTRMGLGFRRPEEWEEDLLNERLDIEARGDVLTEEITELKKRLSEAIARERKPTDEKIIEFGPIGNIEVHGFNGPEGMCGLLKTIDKQHVTRIATGEMIIDDERSPYDGMLVADYREFLMQPWSASRKRLLDQRAAAMLKNEQDEARAKGLFIPQELSRWPSLHPVAKWELPPWPQGIANMKQPEPAADDSATVQRKRKTLTPE